jgi:hypothetical protein
MAFRDTLAAVDAAVGGQLGEPIVYTPGVGSPVTVQGIHDRGYLVADGSGLGDAGVMTSRPAVSLMRADLPSDPKTDTAARLTIRAEVFKVWKVENDGQGRLVLVLQLA